MTAVIGQISLVDAVRPTDRYALDDLFSRCSPGTVRRRFIGQPRALPREFVDEALAGRPERHDAVVVRLVRGAGLAGLASLGVTAPARPELGVLVADAWQGHGLGAAMVETLVGRARRRGVVRISAFVRPGRSALLNALARRLPPEGVTRTSDGLVGVFRR
jgi:GNAT superfamily N-acetyltransferase